MTDEAQSHDAEVDLGRAQEFYAHALRVGDTDAAATARSEVATAKLRLAADRKPSEAISAGLENDLVELRRRLAGSEIAEPAQQASRARPAVSGRLTASPYAEADVVQLATMRSAVARPDVLALVAFQDRTALREGHQVLLEELGGHLALELADLEAELARLRDRINELSLEPPAPRFPFVLESSGVGLRRVLTVVAAGFGIASAFTQYVIARPIFDGLVAPGATMAAAGYVASVACAAWLAGQFRASRSRYPGAGRALLALLLTITLLVPTVGSGSFPDVGAQLLLGSIGWLFVVLIAGLARVASGSHETNPHDVEAREVRQRYAALLERRRALLRTYIARASPMLAEARKLDALYVREALLRHPDLADQLPPTLGEAVPVWLRDALYEFHKTEDDTLFRSVSWLAPVGVS